jgi:hypothetical protein
MKQWGGLYLQKAPFLDSVHILKQASRNDHKKGMHANEHMNTYHVYVIMLG